MKLLSLFTGIGSFEKALHNISQQFELINYCEIDKYASRIYSYIHNVDESCNLWDVRKVDTSKLPAVDLITYGFPCQDISIAGEQKGFIDDNCNQTRSGLFFEALRIIEDTQPKYAIAENVKALTSKRFKAEFDAVLSSLNSAGYNNYWDILNSKDYGIPQSRERVFIVSIRKDIDDGLFCFPKRISPKLSLKDMLESSVADKYYIRNDKADNVIQHHKSVLEPANKIIQIGQMYPESHFNNSERGRIYSKYGIAPTLKTVSGGGLQPKIIDNDAIRRLTPREYYRLMGFTDEDFNKIKDISDAQLYKTAGNSIVVNVLERIFEQLL